MFNLYDAKMIILPVLAGILSILINMPSSAAVKPNGLFSDGAVLQQGMPVPVWGTAADGEKVTVEFQGQTASAVAENGRWMIKLKPLHLGGPYTMTISGQNTIKVNNVLVGEVWICSGQSNMELPLSMTDNLEEAQANPSDPSMRLTYVPDATTPLPLKDVQISWSEDTPKSLFNYPAVAYFFGRELRKNLGVPVGLIRAAAGATPAETWTPLTVFREHPELKVSKYIRDLDRMRNNPGGLYNGMVAPLIPYAFRGVIWYQGESNAGRAYGYRTLFPKLIKSWRQNWGEGDFPFLFVQLAPYNQIVNEPGESTWAELREAQLMTVRSVPNTAMVVITDTVKDGSIHPRNKKPVGERLALAARNLAYGEKIVYSGPLYKSMKIKDDKAIISFDDIDGGLVAKDGELKGFTIAGADRKFVNAQAEIVGKTVVVWNPEIKAPAAVRFGWADYPVTNLFNKEGLPASPFRTDDFPGITILMETK